MIKKGATVAVLGLSYNLFQRYRRIAGRFIAEHLSASGVRVVAFDPMANEMQLENLRKHIVVLDSIEECLKQAEAVLITTPDPLFKELTADSFKNEWPQVLVFDFWRILQNKLSGAPHVNYVASDAAKTTRKNTARLKNCGAERARKHLKPAIDEREFNSGRNRYAVHNRKEITLQCLKSLSKINQEGLDVHIIVSMTARPTEHRKLSKADTRSRGYQGDGNLWYTEGTNVGVRAALKYEPKYVFDD
jgi:hypothetical protein